MTAPDATVEVTPELDAGGYTPAERDLLNSLGGYQSVFDAIADATSPFRDHPGIDVSVRDFIRSIQPRQQAERPRFTNDAAAEVTLAQCPIGLFWSGDELCLKTEYGTNEGRIDAYIVSSGEFFWGNQPQTIANQRMQMVVPVDPASIFTRQQAERDTIDWIGDGDREPVMFVLGETITEKHLDTLRKANADKERDTIAGGGPCVVCGIENPSHFTHGAPFGPDYHEYQPALATPAGVEGMREALQPFADAAKWVGDDYDEDYCPDWSPFIAVRHYRNASAALSTSPDTTGDGDRLAQLSERFSDAAGRIHFVSEALAKGYQFNAYERAGNDEDDEDEDREYRVGIGPISDFRVMFDVDGHATAELVETALRIAALSRQSTPLKDDEV